MHLVFHINLTKLLQEDPSRTKFSIAAPIDAKASYGQDFKFIVADRLVRKQHCKPIQDYLFKWEGLSKREAS